MPEGVSIIIPTYNRSSMLRKTLWGLIAQKGYHVPHEVIVVDNGSEEDVETSICDLKARLPILFLKRKISERHFRLGSARNIGVMRAKYDYVLFLDSDCVPSEYFLLSHWKELSSKRCTVTIGHRVFISGHECSENMISSSSMSPSTVILIRSASNYLELVDRRIPELNWLSQHPAPYNCLHGCNIGMRKADFLRAGMFDVAFDGVWGYEDIELGYRLFLSGIEFIYLPHAFVYHLEGEGLSMEERLIGRRVNYALACKKIPDYHSFRKSLGR